MMKNIMLLTTGLLLVLILSHCRKQPGYGNNGNGQNIVINFPYTDTGSIKPEVVQYYYLFPTGFYVEFPEQFFPTRTDEFLGQYGKTREDIISGKAKNIAIHIENNPGQTLDFLDTIKVFIDSAHGSNKVLIAYKYNYPMGLRDLNMDLVDMDIKDYFNADTMKIVIGGTKRGGSSAPQAGTVLRFDANFELEAKP